MPYTFYCHLNSLIALLTIISASSIEQYRCPPAAFRCPPPLKYSPAKRFADGPRLERTDTLNRYHISPEADFYDLVFSETEVSSSCELLYNVLMSMPEIGGHAERLGIETGTALMLGMTTDSNNFANSTYPSTLEMAGKLIEAGVDRDALLENLYNRYRENRYRFMGHFLSKKMKITEEGVAYAVISAEEIRSFGIKDGETEGFVNMPLGIDTVRMSVFIKEEDNGERFRVSV